MEVDKDGYWLDCHYMSGACYSYENSLRHFKYSQFAAVEKDYGFAVSHLILGLEESIKALLLICLHRNRYFLSTEEKEMIFRKHDFKHFNIRELLLALSSENIESYDENPFAFMDSDKANRFQVTAHFMCKGLKAEPLQEKEINTLVKLISHAKSYKNKGFYVDYRADWKLPEDVRKKDYDNYHGLTQKLSAFINPIFTTSITDDNLDGFLEGKWI